MLDVHTPSYDQPSARGGRPSSEEEWLAAKSYRCSNVADVGLTAKARSNFPGLPANRLGPHSFPLENTELLIYAPSFLESAAAIRSFAKAGGSPPPPPVRPEGSWGRGAGSANYGYQAEGDDVEGQPPQNSAALQVLTRAAMISSFRGFQ